MAISRKSSKSRRPVARNGRAESAKSRSKREAIERLKEWVKPGDTIYTVLRHVSSSGMSRDIDLYKFSCERGNKIDKWYLSVNAATALGMSMAKHDRGIKIGGAGMDMGFELVYRLAMVLFGDGYALNHSTI